MTNRHRVRDGVHDRVHVKRAGRADPYGVVPYAGPRRKHLRLRSHGYRTGVYLVTICVYRFERRLGRIVDGVLCPSPLGMDAIKAWRWVATHPYLRIDAWVVMPHHTHAVVHIVNDAMTLARVVSAFKWKTRALSAARGVSKANSVRWLRRYHDRILRDPRAVDAATRYVVNNPANWMKPKRRYRPVRVAR